MPKIGNDANTDMVNQGGADQPQALTGDAPAAIHRTILDTHREFDPAGDTATLARLAQGFTFSTANVGAEIPAALWRDLASITHDGRVSEATAAFGLIEHEFARAAAEMRNFR